METLIQKRIRTKEPFTWTNEAYRYDTGISCAGGADDTGASTSTTEPISVENLMRYVTSKAGEQVGIPPSERWTGASSEVNANKSAPNRSKERGAGSTTTGTSTSTSSVAASPTKPMLFEAILNLFVADPNEELYVKDVVEKTMDAVNPADVPPELSSTHLILVALSFLSTPIAGLDDRPMANEGDGDEGMTLLRNTFPSLPLLENVSGFSTKITWRKYKLAYSDWKGLNNDDLRRKVHNLEAAFNMSTVAYQTRYCLTPRLSSTEEEKEVLRTGFVPASMDVSAGATPSNSRPNTPTPTAAAKKKKDAPSASTVSTTSRAAAYVPSTAPASATTPAKKSKVEAPLVSSGAPALAAPKPSGPPSTGKRKASSEKDSSSPTQPPTKKMAKTAVNASGHNKCIDEKAVPAIAGGKEV